MNADDLTIYTTINNKSEKKLSFKVNQINCEMVHNYVQRTVYI